MRRLPVLPAFCAASAVDVALAAWGARRIRRFTKPLLMPLLAAHVAGADASEDAKPLVLAGLGLSGLGDIALLAEGDGPFAVGLAAFLGAHCCYLVALARRRRGGARRRWWMVVVYVLAWCALNLVLFPRTGRLRGPVLVYGTALAAMAVAALDTGEPVVAVGGAAFLASDAILALDAFGAARVPKADGAVMLSYTVAQAFIATGLVRPASSVEST